MGNYCASKRDKLDHASRLSKHMMSVYRTELRNKYHDIKQEARDKYEVAKFHYKVRHHKQTFTLEKMMSASSTKFQEVLFKFEREFPLVQVDIAEFERRVKKLVFNEEYIYVWQLIECFKTCKGFEDIENEASLTLRLLTCDYLKHDDEGAGQETTGQ